MMEKIELVRYLFRMLQKSPRGQMELQIRIQTIFSHFDRVRFETQYFSSVLPPPPTQEVELPLYDPHYPKIDCQVLLFMREEMDFGCQKEKFSPTLSARY